MLLLLVFVFVSVFVLLALLLFATGAGASPQSKQTLAHLESALATRTSKSREQIVDLRKDELLSAVPLINRWLLKVELAPRLRMLLYQANLRWTAGGLILMSLTAFVLSGYLVYLRTGAFAFGLVFGAILGAGPVFFVLYKRKSRFDRFEQQLPDALDMIVSALRAGHSLVATLRLVAYETADPLAGEFRICFDEQNYGLELRTAMENLVMRVPLQDLRLVATAILIQKESGGNLAEVLEKGAALIRERFKLRRQVRIHTAQGRLTGWILSLLPVVLCILLYLINPEVMRILWTRPLGLKLMYGAATMVIIGALIIRKIVQVEI